MYHGSCLEVHLLALHLECISLLNSVVRQRLQGEVHIEQVVSGDSLPWLSTAKEWRRHLRTNADVSIEERVYVDSLIQSRSNFGLGADLLGLNF